MVKMPPLSESDQRFIYTAMYGDTTGNFIVDSLIWIQRFCYPSVECSTLRILLAPHEMSPYNRFAGYCHAASGYILFNRHRVNLHCDGIDIGGYQSFFETLVHEVAHARQSQLLKENMGRRGWAQHRGHHRDRGWYYAVAEAFPALFNRVLTEDCMPIFTSKRSSNGSPIPCLKEGALSETDLCSFPCIESIKLESIPQIEVIPYPKPYETLMLRSLQ
jgi:hypothetical protein